MDMTREEIDQEWETESIPPEVAAAIINQQNNRLARVEEGELKVRTTQPDSHMKAVHDSVVRHQLYRGKAARRHKDMGVVAQIPWIIEEQWLREWRERGRERWTWQHYKAMKINSSEGTPWRVSEMPINTWEK